MLLQVAFAGLCGTDLSTFLGKNPNVEYPRVIGHEISGRVIETGPGVGRDWQGVAAAVSPQELRGVPRVPARPAQRVPEQRDARRAARRRAGRICRGAGFAPGAVAESATRRRRRRAVSVGVRAVRRAPRSRRATRCWCSAVAASAPGRSPPRRRWALTSSDWTWTKRSSIRPVGSAPRRPSTDDVTSPSRSARHRR